VFVDETWAKTNMAPLRGWVPKGQRLHAKVPYGHWKTMTFIAALRSDRIDAPFVFDQPINSTSFTQWVKEQLCPTLSPGDIVILDNLFSHKKPLSGMQSGPEARACCSFRPTAQTSTRSSRSSPS
jgi:DDE superfamily endonuclease